MYYIVFLLYVIKYILYVCFITIITMYLIEIKLGYNSQVWWHRPIISAFRGQMQEDHEFESNLDYIRRYCLKNT